jgi:hypothetical protein
MTTQAPLTPLPPPQPNSDQAYRQNRRRTRHPFNFELDDSRRTQLRAIADSRGISMGATLRQLISTAHLMDCQNRPHCVNGRICLVPHLHPISQPQPPTQEAQP